VRDRQSGAEFPKNARARFVGSAVCDIDGDRHFLERHFPREAGFRELDITPQRIIDSSRASDFSCGRANGIDLTRKDELFDLLLEWAGDDATRHRILVDNPARLYGF
jgi:hypothetical protein